MNEDKPARIAVIGAGAAGWSAAAVLAGKCKDRALVTVFEARDRIGGRIHTVDASTVLNGANESSPVVDLGAQWSHNHKVSVIAELLDEAGLEISVPESWSMDKEALIMWKKHFPDVSEEEVRNLDKWSEPLISHVSLRWDLICKEEGLDIRKTSVLDVLKYCLRSDIIQAWLKENRPLIPVPSEAAIALCFEHQRNLMSNFFGIEAQHTSYESLDPDEGEHEHRVVTNGFIRLINMLRRRSEGSLRALKLSSVVSGVKAMGEEVLVTWNSDDEVFEEVYDYVVVTLPLGVLKLGRVTFDPPLPEPISTSIDRLAVGLLHKTIVLFSADEWSKVSLPGTRILYPSDHAHTFSFILHLGEEAFHGPGLYGYAAYACYPWAAVAEELSDEELSALFMIELSRALEQTGKPSAVSSLPKPCRLVTTSWLSDPFSCGAYSAQSVDSPLSDFDAFSETPYGHVYFAGEHCQSEMYGCVTAAIDTGNRAGEKIAKKMEIF
jgi:polyamine oxidase